MNADTVIGVLGLAAGALLLWAIVRLVNRGWRKSKGALAVVVVLIAFPLMLGPSCWLCSWTGRGREIVSTVYSPLIRASRNRGMRPFEDVLVWYSCLAAADGWDWQFYAHIIRYPDADDSTRRQAVNLSIKWGADSMSRKVLPPLRNTGARIREQRLGGTAQPFKRKTTVAP